MDVDAEDFFDELDYALHLARARRAMSQRDFAALLGLSPARVARMENGEGLTAVREVQRALTAAGLSLAVVEVGSREVASGDVGSEDWEPSSDPWELRDRAGRRFPAHRFARLRRGEPTWEWARYRGHAPALTWSVEDPVRAHRELRQWLSRRSADGSS